MRKRLTGLLLAACMVLSIGAPAWATEQVQMEGEEDVTLQPSTGVRSRQYGASNGTLIVTLDPGHGGKDSGATAKWNGKTAMEKDMNLKIGLACREELSKYAGVKVYMTRDDDTFLELSDRVKYAQSVNADLMVSLHINSADSSSARGELVIVPNGNYRPALLTESKKTASRILS
ncbi:N-acetylmuramoyl-L-alanine amidase family protein, partial [Butyricicoccus sp.]|uniref:N-acetylmuramoyl-L-alanine amidase family protein n=1 Tax=Butyricicoccus sp. TaxID=2049021 RepID=UPI003D7D4D5F